MDNSLNKDNRPSILLVDDEPSARRLMSELLTRSGYRAYLAESGPEALGMLRRIEVDLVLTDVVLGEMDGLELLKRIKTERPGIGVVIYTGYSTENLIIEALRAGAADFIKKPFSRETLEMVLDRALKRNTFLDRLDIDVDAVIAESKIIEIDNNIDRISGVVNQLTLNASKFSGVNRANELSVALYEIILNAMEHGNLEITYEEKAEYLDRGTYQDLIMERRKDPRLSARKVRINYHMDDTGLHYTIQDQGPGFDWKKYYDKIEKRGVSTEAHGRGLALTLFYVDRIKFNEKGNEVRLSLLK